VTGQQNWIFILKSLFPHKLSDVSFTNPTSTVGLQLLNLWLLWVMLRCVNDGVTNVKPVHEIAGNAWYGQVSRPSRCSPTSGRVYVWRTPKEAYNPECLVPTGKHGGGSMMVWAAISWYSILLVPWPNYCKGVRGQVGLSGASHDPHVISEQRYSSPRLQCPINTAETVQSWFQEHKGKLQHLPWPAQSPDLNITEPLWSVLEARVRTRFPASTSLKKLEDVLQEEWYKISIETVQTCTVPFQEGLRLYWRQKMVQHHINKEMCAVSIVFPLFCPPPACFSFSVMLEGRRQCDPPAHTKSVGTSMYMPTLTAHHSTQLVTQSSKTRLTSSHTMKLLLCE
jgi:hypothetical protein